MDACISRVWIFPSRFVLCFVEPLAKISHIFHFFANNGRSSKKHTLKTLAEPREKQQQQQNTALIDPTHAKE
jgi:hypothetical protein